MLFIFHKLVNYVLAKKFIVFLARLFNILELNILVFRFLPEIIIFLNILIILNYL